MSRIVSGNALGMQVLEVLGLEAKDVASIQINMRPNCAAEVVVTLHIRDDEADGLVGCIRTHKVIVEHDQNAEPVATNQNDLIAALARQTQAMQALAESNRLLAESNREMVDFLADQQDEGGDLGNPRFDLAGKPL